jgi:hypothetical protein
MRVAVLGFGNIGRTLAVAWQRAGHQVVVGARDPAATATDVAAALGPAAEVRTVAEAIAGAEAVLLAVPGAAVPQLLSEHGPSLAGVVLLDAANDVGGSTLHQAQVVASLAPDAHAFRAFNTLGWENLADPVIGGVRADLVHCGPDGAPRQVAERLIADVGLRPVYVGGADAADVVDGVARLWFALAFGQGRGRRIAFKVLEP